MDTATEMLQLISQRFDQFNQRFDQVDNRFDQQRQLTENATEVLHQELAANNRQLAIVQEESRKTTADLQEQIKRQRNEITALKMDFGQQQERQQELENSIRQQQLELEKTINHKVSEQLASVSVISPATSTPMSSRLSSIATMAASWDVRSHKHLTAKCHGKLTMHNLKFSLNIVAGQMKKKLHNCLLV